MRLIDGGWGGHWERNVKRRVEVLYRRYIVEILLRQKPLPPSKDGRHVPLKLFHQMQLIDERKGNAYISNTIRSSRYTLWDFIPKQLTFQFTRLANFYFLCIGIPQTIPGVSTTGNYTTILPLLFFVLLTIVKEGYDDYRRHRLDNVENRNLATVLRKSDHVGRGHVLERVPGFNLVALKWRNRLATIKVYDVDEDEDEDAKWARTQWRDIYIGDIVKLRRDEAVPADMVLLYADGGSGLAYVETMALDGETNLKSKQALPIFNSCATIQGLRCCTAESVVEDPNPDLYNFNGRLNVQGKTIPLTLSEVLLRGCVIRNTGCAIGLVINTGEECKIRMNANHHPTAKKPHLESYANQVVLTLVIYVVILSIGCSMGYLIWRNSTERKSWYLANASVGLGYIVAGFAIEFNNVIPLALYVSLEIVKLGQMMMVNGDVEMYDEASDTPMRCNTNTILENLGQVQFIMSDKTGTLTENVMKFRKMTIAGVAWAHDLAADQETDQPGTEEHHVAKSDKEGPFPVNEKSTLRKSSDSRPRPRARVKPCYGEFSTSELVQFIRRNPQSSYSQKARDFVLGLALCHACLPEERDGVLDFQGASPDEVALVRAAQDLGYRVVQRTSQLITLLIERPDGTDEKVTYEILDVIEFSSKRKRMTVILKRPDGGIWLICKGADSIIFPRLEQAVRAMAKAAEVQKAVDLAHRRTIELERETPRNSFGGRPSVTIRRSSSRNRSTSNWPAKPASNRAKSFEHVARSRFDKHLEPSLEIRPVSLDVSPTYTRSMLPTHRHSTRLQALASDRSFFDDASVLKRSLEQLHDFATDGLRTLVFAHKIIPADAYSNWKRAYAEATTSLIDRQERIEAAAEVIEQSLTYLGATAIEDKLQKSVPETIDKLRRANIRVWMLTGDKRETAINIAHSAKIARPDSEIFVLDSSKGAMDVQLAKAEVVIRSAHHCVVVIDGHTLANLQSEEVLRSAFFTLIPLVDSVICCRASPAQKADIVREIRHRVPGALTLAIGDGANDIAMIQSAHVGVGISGKEGLQAARVADYSIAQFRFLQRLLLVHGRWNYMRTAKFILMTFWKEFFFYMMQAMYQRYNGYTGTSLYESWSLTVLNTLFTSLCVIVMGILEQDLSADTLLAMPELYVYGQQNMGLNLRKYLAWIMCATVEGMIVWFITWAAYGRHYVGGDQGLFALGDLSFSLGIVWTNWKLFIIEAHHKTAIVLAAFSITIAGWWAWNGLLSAAYAPSTSPYDFRDGFTKTFGNDPIWWLTLVNVFVILVTLELLYKTIKRNLIMAGRWPPWRRRRNSMDCNVEKWNLEMWQEIERGPAMKKKLKKMAHGEMEIDNNVNNVMNVDG